MKKLIFILILFISFQSFGQNRFPTIDSLQTYILRYFRNSTVETFTNLRGQNIVYGLSEFIDSLAGNGAVDSIWIVDAATDTLKYRKQGVTYVVGAISGGGGSVISASGTGVSLVNGSSQIKRLKRGIGIGVTDQTDSVEIKLDTSYGKKYFLFGLAVPTDSTVMVDTSEIATLTALRDTAAALRTAIGSGGGGGVADTNRIVFTDRIQTIYGQKTFNPYDSVGGVSADIAQALIVSGILGSTFTSDTLAAIDIQTLLRGNSKHKWGIRSSAELNIQMMTVGTGNNMAYTLATTSLGYKAGYAMTSNGSNSFVGYLAGQNVTTGYFNSFLGDNTGVNITTGIGNTLIGSSAGYNSASSRSYNTLVGGLSGYSITGNNNTGIGYDAARAAGSRNVMIGEQAGYTTATGDDNVFVGYKSGQRTGSNLFEVSNRPSTYSQILIHGNFSNRQVKIGDTATSTVPTLTTGINFEVVGTTKIQGVQTEYTATATGITLGGSNHVVNVTATGQTITLPTAVGIAGRQYTIKLTASGTGTVATTSSQTIDGSTTYSLSAQYKYVTVVSDGANWIVVANN